MIQIGSLPLSTAFPEGPSADANEVIGHKATAGREPAAPPRLDADDGVLFVSPPPLPFPRVFPGL
jgi:hypothetical protein